MNEVAYREAEARHWSREGAVPRELWLDLDHPSTRVRVLEVGSGPPLLFVHGGPAAATIFAAIAARMPERRCLLLDRPGCGTSPPIAYDGAPHDVTMPDVLRSSLDALGLDRIDLVGSSFGGACALWLAGRFPERVGRIVLLGSPAFIPPMRTPLFLRLLATPGLGLALARLPPSRLGTIAFLHAMGEAEALRKKQIPEEFIDWWISLGRDTDTIVNERALIRRGLTPGGMRPELVIPESSLRALPHPIDVQWGPGDPIVPVDEARRLFSGMPHARFDVIPGAGHLPWLADPAGAARRASAFLSE